MDPMNFQLSSCVRPCVYLHITKLKLQKIAVLDDNRLLAIMSVVQAHWRSRHMQIVRCAPPLGYHHSKHKANNAIHKFSCFTIVVVFKTKDGSYQTFEHFFYPQSVVTWKFRRLAVFLYIGKYSQGGTVGEVRHVE